VNTQKFAPLLSVLLIACGPETTLEMKHGSAHAAATPPAVEKPAEVSMISHSADEVTRLHILDRGLDPATTTRADLRAFDAEASRRAYVERNKLPPDTTWGEIMQMARDTVLHNENMARRPREVDDHTIARQEDR